MVDEINELIREELFISGKDNRNTLSCRNQAKDMEREDECVRSVENLAYLASKNDINSSINRMYCDILDNYDYKTPLDEQIYASNAFKKLMEMEQYYNFVINNETRAKTYRR